MCSIGLICSIGFASKPLNRLTHTGHIKYLKNHDADYRASATDAVAVELSLADTTRAELLRAAFLSAWLVYPHETHAKSRVLRLLSWLVWPQAEQRCEL